jgi:N-acetylneuraminic acid mutarotase
MRRLRRYLMKLFKKPKEKVLVTKFIPCSLTLVGVLVLTIVNPHDFFFDGSPILNTASSTSTTSSELSSDTLQKQSWTMGEKMPTPRTELQADSIEDKIYAIGGVEYTTGGQLDTLEIYDTKKNEWNTNAMALPQAIDHGAAASYNGKIYVVGGFTGVKVPTDKLFIYDPMKDEWKEGQPLPSPRGALSAEFINGTLYALGGLNSSHVPVNTNEAYDPETNTWVTKTPMPTARHHLASAVIDGKLYAIGGRILGNGVPSEDIGESSTNFNRNEMYDPETDTWATRQPMLDKISGFEATSANGQIYVFGGEGVGKTLDSVEKYNPATNKWTYESSLPTKRIGLEAVTVGDKIYTIGGQIVTPEKVYHSLDVNEIFNVKEEN